MLEDLPGPEDLLADAQSVLAELRVGAAALGVEGKIALQMRPTGLPTADGQMAVGPPAIAGDDRLRVGEQVLGTILVAVGSTLRIA